MPTPLERFNLSAPDHNQLSMTLSVPAHEEPALPAGHQAGAGSRFFYWWMAVGVVFGVMAGIPAALLVLATGRRSVSRIAPTSVPMPAP